MKNSGQQQEPVYAHSQNPFDSGWTDLFFEEGVITFFTYDYVLYENHNYGSFTDKNGDVLEPGVYRDKDFRDGGEDNLYTVILDHKAPIIRAYAEQKIEELNEKYGTNFHPNIITTSFENLKEAGLIELEEVELK